MSTIHHFPSITTTTCLTALYPGRPREPVPEETFTHSQPVFVASIQHFLINSPFPFPTVHSIFLAYILGLTIFFYNLTPSFLCPAPG